MKLAKRDLSAATDRPNPNVRFYLFHGADESQSRSHGERLLAALGAEKFVVAASAAKSDPALLADEAGAIGLFGDKRAIWVEPAGDDIADAVEALLGAGAAESPVIAIAGSLRKGSWLLRLAEEHGQALAFASYVPEGQDAERMVIALAQQAGLRVRPDVAARLADACRNDRAVVAQELAKFACYLDAGPQQPKDLDHETIDAVGADMAEASLGRLADLALAGEVAELADELARLPSGSSAIPVVRALQRRLLQVAPARARVERGERVDAVMASLKKSLFFKDEALVGKLLRKWDAEGLATVAERAGRLERSQMAKAAPPDSEALGEELVAIARAAARRR
jgi:DNA polymerase III subunit delta